MIFGIVEVSIGLYTYHYLSDAARDGSRWAMVRGLQLLHEHAVTGSNAAEGTYTCPGRGNVSRYFRACEESRILGK